jgi:hypothetical protein
MHIDQVRQEQPQLTDISALVIPIQLLLFNDLTLSTLGQLVKSQNQFMRRFRMESLVLNYCPMPPLIQALNQFNYLLISNSFMNDRKLPDMIRQLNVAPPLESPLQGHCTINLSLGSSIWRKLIIWIDMMGRMSQKATTDLLATSCFVLQRNWKGKLK